MNSVESVAKTERERPTGWAERLLGQLRNWARNLLQITFLADNYFVHLFKFLPLTAALYYLVLNRSFRREQHATLLGRIQYMKECVQPRITSSKLRRNIHRIEKGLIMRPRRPTFALDYIDETVDLFSTATAVEDFSRQELEWAGAVLDKYFSSVIEEGPIRGARTRFYQSWRQVGASDTVPYLHRDLPDPAISIDQLDALAVRRRSVRWFKSEPVPDDLLNRAIEVATNTPSACNRQPYTFFVVNSVSDAPTIAGLAMGTSGYAHNIPCLIVVVGNLSAYAHERDRHLIYIDSSLAAMQLMLALETQGLSTCPINWPDIASRDRAMQKALSLAAYEKPIMLIAVGYADPMGGIAYSQKKPIDLVRREVTVQQTMP